LTARIVRARSVAGHVAAQKDLVANDDGADGVLGICSQARFAVSI
jgi:hypothetical protein